VSARAENAAVLAPGYGGTSEQPILKALATSLTAAGIRAVPISFSRARPTGTYASELDDVRRARDELLADGVRQVVLVGRSFGGRMCTRLAALESPAALVVLGHPISPPRRPRPDDEQALAEVRCPTLIVQGDHDALGPLDVLQRIALENRVIRLEVLTNTGHQFGPRQGQAVEFATRWLVEILKI
jgi:predicted alpha/beta-hydrolase family hydrolase